MSGPTFKANVSGMTFGHKKGRPGIKARNRQPLEEKSQGEKKSEGKHRAKKKKALSFVILVDKNCDFQNSVRSGLTKMKIELRTAAEPMKAKNLYLWEKESRGYVDLVVSCLDVAESLALLDGIRQKDPQARIVVICQNASLDERTKLDDAGAFAVIERKNRPSVAELQDIIAENIGLATG